ncbi:uncharacterized protein SPSC_01030 [Sporisorium scitamineum]|uniref:Ricin B lectin domain-containing protein n=1 Tax=Sporisorium scitamineum TaxID=49012 RepID=A0A0F7RVP0_9BASI|nr:hypothetical protein [Sporisorium scitamineum]CDU22400.1 uncharacterized protein SPSC_01030 [Sporisorium scitamineum]
MKSIIALSSLVAAALTTSVAAMPTPSQPVFTSRMVRRDVGSDTCGKHALPEPQKLQLQYNNGTILADLTSIYLGGQDPGFIAVKPETFQEEEVIKFDFQTCDYQGFTQGYSRNAGGSMGAPLEYWDRVVANVTTSDGSDITKFLCLSADVVGHTSGLFNMKPCDDSDSRQWFRLQESFSSSLSYFPIANTTDYKYDGQTPEYFDVFLPAIGGTQADLVQYQPTDSQQIVVFTD